MARSVVVAVMWMTAHGVSVCAEEPWWRDAAVQRQLALTADQVASIEAIDTWTLKQRRALSRALDRADRAVQDALRRNVSDAQVARLVERAESVRVRRNVARAMLLFRMYRALTPAQRRMLGALRVNARAPNAPGSPLPLDGVVRR